MDRICVFLSHSSRDKNAVRRINRDIKSHGFDTWLDEDKISYGASITAKLQEGLDRSNIIFVFLSEHSISSKWVEVEWRSKFFDEVNERAIIVVPVLLDRCRIPTFLRDKKYIDFSDSSEYDKNLAEVLRFLSSIGLGAESSTLPTFRREEGLLSAVKEIMDELEKQSISIPLLGQLYIVDSLKKIPRSGKRVRLSTFQPRLRPRSVYDHVLSLAHLADCLLPCIKHDLDSSDLRDFALCIAYHEINEIVLGDIPSYTSLDSNQRSMIKIFAEERLRSVAPDIREEIANKFIWLFLSEKHRLAFNATQQVFKQKKGKVFPLFRALDKLDPIVAVWRYLHHFRGRLGENPREFNSKMKDFYENPDVRNFMRDNKLDNKLIDLTITLQNRTNSWNYYEDSSSIFSDVRFFKFPLTVIKNAIEGIPLFADTSGNFDGMT